MFPCWREGTHTERKTIGMNSWGWTGVRSIGVHSWFSTYSICVCVCVCSVASTSLQPNGLYVAHQAPLSMEFSRQEYWSGLPFPTPGNLPISGIKHTSPVSPALAGRFFTTEPPEKPFQHTERCKRSGDLNIYLCEYMYKRIYMLSKLGLL